MSDNYFGLGTGITITTGFDLTTKKPLDSRTVVNNIGQLRALPEDRVYKGLLVHVVDEDKLYQWKKSVDDSGQVILDKNGNPVYDWGPIEAEVSAKEVEDVDYSKTPSLLLQKNKQNFFPVTHEKYVVDDKGKNLTDKLSEKQETIIQEVKQDLTKYQLKEDNTLETDKKTVVGSINEINSKMEDAIAEFRDEIEQTLSTLRADINAMIEETESDLNAAKDAINAQIAQMNKTINDSTTAMNDRINKMMDDMDKEIANKMAQMDNTFNTKMVEINNRIANIENEINSKINAMLQDVDNVILSDLQVTDVMNKINANITNVDKI